jgi:hypothetical protein
MKKIMITLAAALTVALAPLLAAAFTHGNRAGGSTTHMAGEGTEHTNAYGGNTEHAYGGGTEHNNVYGGTTEGKYGDGAYHSTPYGATAYRPPEPDAYAYHPPTTVNYYGAGCYNCGGYSTAGAVAAGVVVGAAAASVADESKTTTTTYVVGNIYPTLPGGCSQPTVQGTTYYLCGNTWFKPSYGANGVYYQVVPAP